MTFLSLAGLAVTLLQSQRSSISVLLTDQAEATFWTFFGLEDDVVEVSGEVVKVNSREIAL